MPARGASLEWRPIGFAQHVKRRKLSKLGDKFLMSLSNRIIIMVYFLLISFASISSTSITPDFLSVIFN